MPLGFDPVFDPLLDPLEVLEPLELFEPEPVPVDPPDDLVDLEPLDFEPELLDGCGEEVLVDVGWPLDDVAVGFEPVCFDAAPCFGVGAALAAGLCELA